MPKYQSLPYDRQEIGRGEVRGFKRTGYEKRKQKGHRATGAPEASEKVLASHTAGRWRAATVRNGGVSEAQVNREQAR